MQPSSVSGNGNTGDFMRNDVNGGSTTETTGHDSTTHEEGFTPPPSWIEWDSGMLGA